MTGLREKPTKGMKEMPYHMTSIVKRLFPDADWQVGKGLVTTDGEKAYKLAGNMTVYPDLLSTDLRIIIEIDGDGRYSNDGHFTSTEKAKHDIWKKGLYDSLGYKVVAIPPYIQLDAAMIDFYFGIEYGERLYPAAQEHGFAHPDIPLPAAFCKLGLERFCKDMECIPASVREKIIETLRMRVRLFEEEGFCKEDAIAKVLPPSVQHLLKL